MSNELPVPLFGRGLVEEISSENPGKCVIYTQEVPWKLYAERFSIRPTKTEMIEEVSLESLRILAENCTDCDTVIAFGGGLAIDSAKYAAWKAGKRFVAVPTVISADVSVCRAVAVREKWKVRYIGDKMPDELLIDFDIIQSAPAHLNRGGVCDILSCYTALKDWEISHANTGEAIDGDIVARTQDLLSRLFTQREDIRNVTEEGIRLLIEGYLEEVRLCEEYGSARPEEGSEHFFAYNLEHLMQRPFLHGNIVCLGVVLMTILQERDPREVVDFLEVADVRWRPEDAGLAYQDIVRALETLHDYCTGEEFYYTIVNHKRPDKNEAVRVTDTMKNL
jgi:glycerol dehydrogenase-like iron-containing ADH family enzyme